MSLKEMVGLPLMYPDIFTKFSISPPKGVLFHGPPGTGMHRLILLPAPTSFLILILFRCLIH